MACNDAAASKHFKLYHAGTSFRSVFKSLIQQLASVKSSAPTRPPLKVSRLTTQAHRSIDLQNLVKQPAAVKFSVPPRPPPRTSKRYHAFAKLGLIFQALVKPTAYRGRHRCPHRRLSKFSEIFSSNSFAASITSDLHLQIVFSRNGYGMMTRAGACLPFAAF